MDSLQSDWKRKYVLPKPLIRYYLQRQFCPSKPKKLVILIETIVTFQLLTLMIPPSSESGFPWEYSHFWPLWYTLNAIGRQDRLLQLVGVEPLTLLYAVFGLVGGRLLLLSVVSLYLAGLTRREFQAALKKGIQHTMVRYLSKVEKVTQVVLDRVVSVPLVSFVTYTVVCGETCVPRPYLILCAFVLPVSIAIIIFDRVNTCDLLWSPYSDSLHKSSSQLVVASTELFAAVIVPLCAFESHSFLLRTIIAVCGGVKAGHIYAGLPFHTDLMNTVESIQGVILIWEVVLLTVTVNYDPTGLTSSICFAVVSPILFFLNRGFVLWRVSQVATAAHITSDSVHDYILRAAMKPKTTHKRLEDEDKPDDEDPRLSEVWINTMSCYPLIWTGYMYYHQKKKYFMKLVISQLAGLSVNWLTCLAYETCLMRLNLLLMDDYDDASLQNFLTLKQTQEKIRSLDCEACMRLKSFYMTLRSTKVKYNLVYAQVLMLDQQLTKVLKLYSKASKTFSKKESLLQGYSGLLEIIGNREKVGSYTG